MLFCSDLSEKKRAFLTGTLLLTAAGFLCRLLGFFYRIFLSRTIGAEGLGIYNMVHPVYGICFALCGGSIQTALSQYIAAHESQGRKVFRTGLTISMVLSGILAFLICQYSAWIASHILIEPRCAPYLPVMGLSLPFASFHACANGYCYGAQKIPGSRIFPGGRAGRPHEPGVPDRREMGGRGHRDHRAAGCLRSSDRRDRSGIL